MKRTNVPLFRKRVGRSALAAATLLLACASLQAQIQVTATGAGPLTFDTLPPATDWKYLSISGGGTTWADAAGVEATVQATAASAFTAGLTTDTANPPGTSGNGRWNSTLRVIQTRPTGNGGTLVLATLNNASPSAITEMQISFDFNSYSAATGHLPGHQVFYSFTGNANEWIRIPELSDNETIGNHSVTLSGISWAAGTPMYLMFADDNADGITDPSYTMDNFAVSFPGQPPVIVQQPAGVTNAEYSVVTLSVAAAGTPPFTYQWYRNGTEIAGATGSTLVVTNMNGSGLTWSQPSDNGNYHIVVTGSVAPPATSTMANVTILADTNAPRFLWAVATNNPLGGIVIHVKLSEPVTVIDTEQLAWEVNVASGPGAPLTIPDVNATVNGTDIYLEYSGAELDSTTSYRVDYLGTPIQDRAQTPNTMTATSVPLYSHETEELALNAVWKYSDYDLAAPAGWTDRTFDDSDPAFWKSGPGVFDGKRGSTLPWCRTEALHNLGPVGTCLVLSNDNAAGATPTMYFRTHFDFSGDPLMTLLQFNGKFDDAAVVYLNGVEIWRVGVPQGTHPHNVYVSSLRSVGDNDAQDMTLISTTALRTGDNVLAVELRQVNATSSDITMGLRLVTLSSVPAGPSGPTMTVTKAQNGDVTISWPGGGTLQRTDVLGPTANWQPVAGATSPYTFTPAAGSQGFFRVTQ